MRQKQSETSKLRLIAGSLKGQKLIFPADAEIRPTTDRIRETLFNWLMHDIQGAVCVDCFAGSGALGFEAISRGAKEVTFIEKNATAIQSLQANSARLKLTNTKVIHADVLAALHRIASPPDMLFLDPPYNTDLLNETITHLYKNKLITRSTLIYFECDKKQNVDDQNQQLERLKEATTGNIKFGLLRLATP